MNAEEARATEAEIIARTSDPALRKAVAAATRHLHKLGEGHTTLLETLDIVALVTTVLVHEGFAIVEHPWTKGPDA